MNKALLAAAAASVVVLAGYSGTAEARCHRVGHHWTCGHHRLHYGHRMYHGSWARAYPAWGYGYGASYGPAYSYGAGYGSYQSGRGMGPAPSSDKH